MTKRYRQLPNILIQREIDGERVVVNTLSGNVHQLNPVGACIWHNLADDNDVDHLAATLVEEFGVDMQTALSDVKAFVAELSEQGLLEEVE